MVLTNTLPYPIEVELWQECASAYFSTHFSNGDNKSSLSRAMKSQRNGSSGSTGKQKGGEDHNNDDLREIRGVWLNRAGMQAPENEHAFDPKDLFYLPDTAYSSQNQSNLKIHQRNLRSNTESDGNRSQGHHHGSDGIPTSIGRGNDSNRKSEGVKSFKYCTRSFAIQAGSSETIPSVDTTSALKFRVRTTGGYYTDSNAGRNNFVNEHTAYGWSEPYFVSSLQLCKRIAYSKHKPELFLWEDGFSGDSLNGLDDGINFNVAKHKRKPSVKHVYFQRIWKPSHIKELVIYSPFWIINKTNISLIYNTRTPDYRRQQQLKYFNQKKYHSSNMGGGLIERHLVLESVNNPDLHTYLRTKLRLIGGHVNPKVVINELNERQDSHHLVYPPSLVDCSSNRLFSIIPTLSKSHAMRCSTQSLSSRHSTKVSQLTGSSATDDCSRKVEAKKNAQKEALWGRRDTGRAHIPIFIYDLKYLSPQYDNVHYTTSYSLDSVESYFMSLFLDRSERDRKEGRRIRSLGGTGPTHYYEEEEQKPHPSTRNIRGLSTLNSFQCSTKDELSVIWHILGLEKARGSQSETSYPYSNGSLMTIQFTMHADMNKNWTSSQSHLARSASASVNPLAENSNNIRVDEAVAAFCASDHCYLYVPVLERVSEEGTGDDGDRDRDTTLGSRLRDRTMCLKWLDRNGFRPYGDYVEVGMRDSRELDRYQVSVLWKQIYIFSCLV